LEPTEHSQSLESIFNIKNLFGPTAFEMLVTNIKRPQTEQKYDSELFNKAKFMYAANILFFTQKTARILSCIGIFCQLDIHCFLISYLDTFYSNGDTIFICNYNLDLILKILFQGPFCPNKYKQQNQNDNNVTPHLCV
jgi:hypothetical protein